MNYYKIYNELISEARSKNRIKSADNYFELHHILPTSLGGSDEDRNRVMLTPREHFIAHYLLWKIMPCRLTRDPILFFKHKGAENSRLYEAARISHIKEMREDNPSLHLSETSRISKSKKLSAYAKNRDPEHNRKISQSKIGYKPRLGAVLSDESKAKISDSLKDHFRKNPMSDLTKNRLRESNIGCRHSAETLKSLKAIAKSRKKWQCPHCKKMYDGGNLKQHMLRHGFSEQEIEKAKR